MDAKDLFDALAREKQPPARVDVGGAVAVGRRTLRRRYAVVAASALAMSVGVTAARLVVPEVPRADTASVVEPVRTSSSATPVKEPSSVGHRAMKKKYSPLGEVVPVPDLPGWIWLAKAPRSGGPVLCATWTTSGGTGCASYPPLTADEFARPQGMSHGRRTPAEVRRMEQGASEKTLRRLIREEARKPDSGRAVYGIAKTGVHQVVAVTEDGRKFRGTVAKGVGTRLWGWAVRYPSRGKAVTLLFMDANGDTLQRVKY
ncbi:hypothetical protein [Nonomuraea longicatena]|uniref:Uncharacterized protein n=1 Tax=Nonomuraea longicatena TaxID=83682 RepID=A0ABN1QV11_9ACTN